jgi:predicted HicB family RNase H-like nuclease
MKPKTKPVYIEPDLHRKLKADAARAGISLAEHVANLLKRK